jgi:hypothetical protein
MIHSFIHCFLPLVYKQQTTDATTKNNTHARAQLQLWLLCYTLVYCVGSATNVAATAAAAANPNP